MEENNIKDDAIANKKIFHMYETSFVCEHHIKDEKGNIISSYKTTLHECVSARNMVDAYRTALKLISQLKKVDSGSTFYVEDMIVSCETCNN